MKRIRQPWFVIREDLLPWRRTLLQVLSFVIPIGVWFAVSYTPFIWHPDIQLDVVADRDDPSTKATYVPGDRVSKEFFPTVVEETLAMNAEHLAMRSEDYDGVPLSASRARRLNKKIMRHIEPIGLKNGWLEAPDLVAIDAREDLSGTEKDELRDTLRDEHDANLYALWGELAAGEKRSKKIRLTDENLAIIEANWALMSSYTEAYDSKKLPSEPLQYLLPQGRPVNPDYLPAPHEVWEVGFGDMWKDPGGGLPTMSDRLVSSLKVVFGGFLLAVLIGLPLGILAGTYDLFARLFEPFIDFFRYMPAPVFGPLLVVLLGIYGAPKIGMVFIGTFVQLVLVTSNTTRLLDKPLIEAARTLGAKGGTLLTRVIVPGSVSKLYVDLRILLGWAWTWLVIAELIGTKSGLTGYIDTQGRFRNFDDVYAVIIMIGLIGFITDQVLQAIGRWLFPWENTRSKGFISKGFGWLVAQVKRGHPEAQPAPVAVTPTAAVAPASPTETPTPEGKTDVDDR